MFFGKLAVTDFLSTIWKELTTENGMILYASRTLEAVQAVQCRVAVQSTVCSYLGCWYRVQYTALGWCAQCKIVQCSIVHLSLIHI